MAADYEKTLRRRKRKRIDQNIPKLLPDERVEVRSLDEGCLGSWHTATVTRCDDLVREVRYDHLLFDDGSSNLIEWVDVSPIIDGVDDLDVVTDNYRGLIRPLPPSLDLGRWSLHYGQCVDMHLEDAWWEGVIFDHEAGSEERNIFFPDMGDEAKAHIEKLRITQVWDEMTEKWKPRGNWLFLDLIEEVEQEWPLPVSVKQIWYEVRVKKGYENLKEWTSSVRETWRKLVLQVLCDNFKLTVKQIIHEFNSSGNLVQGGQPLVELPEPAVDAVLIHEEVFGNSLSILPSEFSDWLNSHEVTSSSMPGHQETLSSLPILTILPFNPDTFSNITCNENSNGSSTKMRNGKLKLLTQRPRLEWLPAGPDMVPEPEFCPHAIIKYCEVSGKRSGTKNLILKARAHLSYLGWKIEFARDGRIIRMRYTSPERKYYLSLLQVCRELKAESGFQSPLPQDDEGRLSLYSQDDQRSLSPITQDSHRKSSSHDGFISSSLQKPKRRKKKSKLHSCPRVAFPPKYCPQAVEDYINGLRKDTALKAKKHLAAVGWSFSIHCKGTELGKRIKNEMRYRSPGGKLFYTLISACEWYNNEAELSFHDTNTFREKQHMNVPRESKGLLALNGSCSPSTDLKFQESSMLQVDLSDRIVSEPTSWMLLPKDPVEQGMANSFGIRKLQKKRKNGIADLPLQTYYQNEESLLLNEQEPGPLVKVADDVNANSSTRVLRSCKRARQAVTPSSHQMPRTVLSWLIDNNVVLPTAKVQYRGRKDAHTMAEGRITRDGIKCCCCQNVFTLTNFEAHAGSTNHRPSANIFLEDGRSLFECQLQLRREKKFRSPRTQPRERKGNWHYSRNDDICSVCHYGGELVLCDQCPSSFHTSCLGLKEVPDGDWFCPSCCCGICGQSRFDKNTQQLTDNRVCSCSQCEHQYHFGCLRDKGLVQSGSYPDGDWFCNTKCEQIYQGLRQLLGKPIPVGIDNLMWTLLKYIKSEDGVHDELYDESSMENYSKLSVALSVMHECFEPVKEPRTRRDIVEDVIFSRWSELNRLNFQGFYTVLLERNDELITVATVRVYGEKVAEVPLVGTRFRYRRLGMCRILMNELEKKLMEFGVERLVLPAIPSVLNTWTTSFGFSKMEESERLKFLDYTFLYFEGTVMCQKLLKKISSSALSPSTGLQQKSITHTDKTGTMDFDGNSGVSVVYQADRVEESEIVDQGFAEGGGLGSNQNVSSPLATVPNEPHLVDCLVEDTDDKEGENSSNGLLRCYKRRISAC